MDGWREVRLGDVCLTNMESYSSNDKWNFVNYLDTGNITSNRIDKIQYIDIECDKLPSRAKRKVKYNSIIYSTVRPNQKHYGIIKSKPENFLVSTGFTVIDVKPSNVDADFLYFLLSSNEITETLHAIAEQSTSAYPSIKASDIEDLKILLPKLSTQKQIASLLMGLENKIATNTAINKNLESQAQAIFKSWFVDFEPFGGEMPRDWKLLMLGDVSIMGAGGDKPEEVSEVKTDKCPYPIYSNGLSEDGLHGYTNNYKISVESVTVSARGTIGFVCLRHIPYTPIVRLITLIPYTDIVSSKYLYLWLKNTHIAGTGTTQQQLTVPAFKKTEILIPTKNEMKSFTTRLNPLFEKIWENQKENEKLATLRDTLLPRLMSGEIDVGKVEV